jgi:hypothetical protein
MFAPRCGANIPKTSIPFPILWEGGRGMGSLALVSSILENATGCFEPFHGSKHPDSSFS